MRVKITFLLLFFLVHMSAQLNERHIYVDIEQNVDEKILINSVFPPSVQKHDYNTTDSLIFSNSAVGSNQYELLIKTVAGFKGEIKSTFQYFEYIPYSAIPVLNYSSITFKVDESKVTAVDDEILSSSNMINVDPLLNDHSSKGNLSLVKLGYVEGGTAILNPNNTIDFNFTQDEGLVMYFIEDSVQTVQSGYIRLLKEDEAVVESRDIYVDNKDAISIRLASETYDIVDGPDNGTLSQIGSSHVWSYTPDRDFSGTDAISFDTPAGGAIDYTIHVLDKAYVNTFLVEDHAYAVTDETLTIDVLANDLKANLTVASHSSELTELSNGVFEYTPPTGFSGDKVFTYSVFSGLTQYTQDIVIHVDEFTPVNHVDNEFEIIESQTLVVTHHSPSDSYYFETEISPSHGTLTILDSQGEEVTDCDTITGENTIIYTPNSGYTGLDEFDIKYCLTTGICPEIIKFDVNVLSSSHTSCLCETDCVYPGDHNDDGLVNIKDVLDLGLNAGSGGPTRGSDFEEVWTGQNSSDWGYSQMNTGIDLKCGDSDGDGYIDADDIMKIDANYGNQSKLQISNNIATSQIPISFIPQSTTADSGDLFVIDIAVGNSAYPAIDMNGLAFSFNIAPELIDSSSVNFYLYDDNWFKYGEPTLEFVNVPYDGRVDMAITHLSQKGSDGRGVIGALEFIIEDELQGLRRSSILESLTETPIYLNNIISVNHFGEYVKHPSYKQVITVGSDNNVTKKENNLESIKLYPNPTNAFIELATESDPMISLEIYDTAGRIIQSENLNGTYNERIDLTHLNPGLYLLDIKTPSGNKIHKVSVID